MNLLKRLGVWAVIVAAILMIPLLAKWPWSETDFIVGAVMLFGSATAYELIARKMHTKNQRIIVGLTVFAILAFVWVGAATDRF